MESVIKGVTKFQENVYPGKKSRFSELASGQNPEVLFITCADSRIDPCLITQTEPGELFICRNAGNIVPPHSLQTGGTTASIEFAIAGLGIKHIVICGHSDCGAMKGALNPDGLDELPHVKNWLGHSRAAAAVVKERHGECNNSHLPEITEENIKLQLRHIATHPAVAAKLGTGEVQLHGWLYDIESGQVLCLDPETGEFSQLEEHYAKEIASLKSASAEA